MTGLGGERYLKWLIGPHVIPSCRVTKAWWRVSGLDSTSGGGCGRLVPWYNSIIGL